MAWLTKRGYASACLVAMSLAGQIMIMASDTEAAEPVEDAQNNASLSIDDAVGAEMR